MGMSELAFYSLYIVHYLLNRGHRYRAAGSLAVKSIKPVTERSLVRLCGKSALKQGT